MSTPGKATTPSLEQGFQCWHDARADAHVCFTGRGPKLEIAEVASRLTGQRPSWARQVHSSVVLDAIPGCTGEGDALISDQSGLVLAVATADCVPLLLASRQQIAAIHAGWRGIASQIVDDALERLEGAPPKFTAWIGPAIGPCCYEVGEAVADAVCAASHPDVRRPGKRGRPHLDLRAAVVAQLSRNGIGEIRHIERCTRCDSATLWSYRRDGRDAGRNLALIWR